MDLKQIEKLMAAMERSSIKKVALKQEGFEIELEKECLHDAYIPPPAPVERSDVMHPPSIRPQSTVDENQEVVSGTFVKSPMVGTFYSASSPEDPPFIKVGDMVEEDTVLCIIEAMKVMNEVKSGVKGRVVEIILNNGEPVEFGSNIFRIES